MQSSPAHIVESGLCKMELRDMHKTSVEMGVRWSVLLVLIHFFY